MSLDATRPKETDFVSSLGGFARETRQAVNDLEDLLTAIAAAGFYHEVNVAVGVSDLAIATYLSDVNYEIVKLTAAGAVTITNISGGTDGMIKMIYFADDNVTFANNANIALNQPAHIVTQDFATGDWLVLALVDSVWREENRLVHV